MASTSISSKSAPLYSIVLRGTTSRYATSSPTAFRPWVSTTPITTASRRVWRRLASGSRVWVLPRPGAYPRKSLNLPVFFVGEHSSSHCSGVLGIAIIVVEIAKGYKVGVGTAPSAVHASAARNGFVDSIVILDWAGLCLADTPGPLSPPTPLTFFIH